MGIRNRDGDGHEATRNISSSRSAISVHSLVDPDLLHEIDAKGPQVLKSLLETDHMTPMPVCS
jgi:hypothetical protein